MSTIIPFQDDLPIPDIVKPLEDSTQKRHLSIKAQVDHVKLHKSLPETEVWRYALDQGEMIKPGSGASFLGPTVEVERGDLVKVHWENGIKNTDTLPYEVVKVPYDEALPSPNPIPQNSPGIDSNALSDVDDKLRGKARNLRATLVTHLHGGRTQPDSDGWPDDTITSNDTAHYTYHNDQNATMLWYHDHANHVTRFNVYAGLAGVWLIRDEGEEKLDLPKGDFELPLVIQDRNLALDGAGHFTGALLHKTEVADGPAEFFGPYTLVNGKIWPKASVEPRLYRLRVLNGSNARTYRLMFLDDLGNSQNNSVWQIGSDQGLMHHKVHIPIDGLVLMPGERVDLLVNFTNFSSQSLYLWNTAEAPFSNTTPIAANPSTELTTFLLNQLGVSGIDAERRPYPQIMRFDVTTSTSSPSQNVPTGSLWAIPRDPVNLRPTMPIRLMALVEKPSTVTNGTPMLVFWEYMEVTSADPAPVGADVVTFSFVDPTTISSVITKQFWKAAEEFYDRLNWRIHLGDTEQWYIVNVSPDTHPIHVHLVDVNVNQQYEINVDGLSSGVPFSGLTEIDGNSDTISNINISTFPVTIPDDQQGPKDTIRINPGEMVGVAMKFSPFCGRYMYHCHILEHEDDDMMRPFIIVPKWIPHHH